MEEYKKYLLSRKLGQITKRRNFLIEYYKDYSDYAISIDPDLYRLYAEAESLLDDTKSVEVYSKRKYSNIQIFRAIMSGKAIIEEYSFLDINNN